VPFLMSKFAKPAMQWAWSVSYPFSPVSAMPSMNVRWAKKNKTMIGRMLITVAAMIHA